VVQAPLAQAATVTCSIDPVLTEADLDACIASAPTNGDTLVINIGANMNLTTDKTIAAGTNVTIQSPGGFSLTRTTTTGYGFTVNNATLSLTNITINGSTATSGYSALIAVGSGSTLNVDTGAVLQGQTVPQTNGNGGAIYATGHAVVNILPGSVIRNNTAGNGGGIYIAGTSATAMATLNITGGTISGNTADVTGAGICTGNYANVTITGATIEQNHAGTIGGGIDMNGAATSTLSITDTGGPVTFSGNTANNNGGGVSLRITTPVTITGATITGNTSTTGVGGGIYNNSDPSLTVDRCTISQNSAPSASGDGGGIWNNGPASLPHWVLIVTDSTIIGNSAGRSGGGISAANNNDVTISGTSVTGNLAAQAVSGGSGAGIRLGSGAAPSSSILNLTDAVITDNFAGYKADGTTPTGFTGNGGGIFLMNYDNVTATGATKIDGNKASQDGGGIYTGISDSLSLIGVEINNNTAGRNGGGININSISSVGTNNIVNLSGSSLTGNLAAQTTTGYGGGIFVGNGIAGSPNAVIMTDATVSGNYVGYQADGATLTGFTGSGGGVQVGNYAVVTAAGATKIDGNKAATNGGGIDAAGTNNSVTVSGTAVVSNNTAVQLGGGIYDGTGTTTIDVTDQAKISGNTAGLDGGGMWIRGQATVSGSAAITGNTAGRNGGGVFLGTDPLVSLSLKDSATVTGNTAGLDGGGVYVPWNDPNKELAQVTVGAGVVFSNNKASRSTNAIKPVDQPTYDTNVLTTAWTTGFTVGYNDYDISYLAYICGDDSATIPVGGTATLDGGISGPMTSGVATGYPSTATVTVDPATGLVTFDAGTTPPGTYTFDVTWTAPDGTIVVSHMTVTVTPLPPVTANPDTKTMPVNTGTSGQLSFTGTAAKVSGVEQCPTCVPVTRSADGSFTIKTAHGTATVQPDGTYTYTPDPGYSGPDVFSYTVTDAYGQTATNTVNLQVTPNAANDTNATTANQPVSGTVLGNDTGAGLSVKSFSQAGNGTVTMNTDGTYTYTPNPGFVGTDTFTYVLVDASGQTVTATVTIVVAGGDGPVPVVTQSGGSVVNVPIGWYPLSASLLIVSGGLLLVLRRRLRYAVL